MNELGEKIKDLRKKRGLSQEELAGFAKVNLRTIQRIEKNESEPRGKTLNLICEVLEINIEDILDYGKLNDNKFLFFYHLSVISFLVIPIGNIILPLILWLTKKNKIIGLNEAGKNLLNFQIIWTILTFTSVIGYAFLKIGHNDLNRYLPYVFISLYITNLIIPIFIAIKCKNGQTNFSYPKLITLIN
jgi:transcriptional regulator with XRE-family HTH domain